MSAEAGAALDGIRAVSFDLDDTFWDCAPAIARAETVLLDWLAEHAPATLEHHRAGALGAARNRLLADEPALAGDVSELRKRALAELFRLADHDHALSEPAFEVFYRARSDVLLYDGVVEMLDAVRRRYQVAAITNGNADLSMIGIDARFDLVLRATLGRPAKPDPFMFEETCRHFGIAPGELLHVGDSVETDVGGAYAAGCRACWFNPEGEPWVAPGQAPDAAPEHVVRSIGELHALLLPDGGAR